MNASLKGFTTALFSWTLLVSAGAEIPLSQDEKILQLLNRFTPGATPELIQEVKKTGSEIWLKRQLGGQVPENEALLEAVSGFETLNLGLPEIFENYWDRTKKGASPEEVKEMKRKAGIPAREGLTWICLRAVWSSSPVREASADFFRNHFAVSVEKGDVRYFIVDWEREVIMKNSLGRFGDMLARSAHHPAMLFFLDNALSRKPATEEELKRLEVAVHRRTGSEERAVEAVEIAKQRGLNENYARELMELHTLGVDNRYKQDDVINVAKALTGWTIKNGVFDFNKNMHTPGDKIFLGTTIEENASDPISEGKDVLDRLARDPGTAHFLSWKLSRWFVSDDPSPALVSRVEKVFLASGGDLPRVYQAITSDPEFYSRKNFRSKFKRPWEYVVSALRVTRAELGGMSGRAENIQRNLSKEKLKSELRPLGIDGYLVAMNEALYRCADPTGFYDQAEAWRDPGAMATRWSFATELSAGRIAGVKIPSSFYADLPQDNPYAWKEILIQKILPVTGLGAETSRNMDKLIERELASSSKPDPEKLGALITAVLLGSPDFQKQ
ncbi:MAG: DUF1800 domain-containing protein [Spirochaetia bacterium]|nr:DUF1800 domain-containing protein [Spirochaetia bacterium]